MYQSDECRLVIWLLIYFLNNPNALAGFVSDFNWKRVVDFIQLDIEGLKVIPIRLKHSIVQASYLERIKGCDNITTNLSP